MLKNLLIRRIASFILVYLFLGALTSVVLAQDSGFHLEPSVSRPASLSLKSVTYYNEACGDCADYVQAELPAVLSRNGVDQIVKKDYINDRANRVALNQLLDQIGLPVSLQSHIMIFITAAAATDLSQSPYILGGHIPAELVDQMFQPDNRSRFQRLLIYQDKMHGDVTDYQVWARPTYAANFVGQAKTYALGTPLADYLDYLQQNQSQLQDQIFSRQQQKESLWPLVLVSGFLDGFNPCAFAVMIFFIAFLFTLRRSLGQIFGLGLVYILVIYLTYLGIGLGLFQALVITGYPHLMAKIGAGLVIILGLVNLKDFILPNLPIHLQIPKFSQGTLKYWLTKATLPAVIVAAFLVGLCTFPCSGGIYVAIVGLLASQGTFWSGLGYLLVYNVMFVLPLVFLLLLAGNKFTLGKVAEWQSRNDKMVKLVLGASMIIIGLIILFFFV